MTVQNQTPLKEIIKDKVKEVLNSTVVLEDDIDLYKAGLDSLGTVKLIVAFEAEFDIEIDDDDLLVETFQSINKIKILLEEKYL